jgi:hypothetical protein
MSKAADAYNSLQEAMAAHPPMCLNDARFIDDNTNARDIQNICERCPLLDYCHDYARIERPRGGIWAGKRWGRS